MTTYRTGNHWGVTIVREAPDSHSVIEPAQLVAVVVNGDQALAERICRLLNADQARIDSDGFCDRTEPHSHGAAQ